MNTVTETNEVIFNHLERVRDLYPEHMTVKQKQDFHFGCALLGIYSAAELYEFKEDIDALPMDDRKRLMRIAATMGHVDVLRYIKECSPRMDTSEALIQAASVDQGAVIAVIYPMQFNTVKARRAVQAAAANGHLDQVKKLAGAVHIVTLESEMKTAGDMDGLKLLYSAVGDVDGAMKIEAVQTKDVLCAAVNAELTADAKRRRM